ncbi:hypothetical protein Glove_37g51 [Diversispora epigaea]|uniref:Uncharacterized protein n=1 Tax=Diversispora epigaea TaxID=1348612 RepID=A0A397JMV0_9GLOM|nr:hypothetical protein Glove_37g51 [Diversispora epigaea]
MSRNLRKKAVARASRRASNNNNNNNTGPSLVSILAINNTPLNIIVMTYQKEIIQNSQNTIYYNRKYFIFAKKIFFLNEVINFLVI